MKFITDDQQLVVLFEGWEVLWGLKRKLTVPKAAITSLSWQSDYKFTGKLLRVVGTGAPWLLYAGYFRANGKRAYLYMQKPRGMSWTVDGVVSAPDMLEIRTANYKYPLVLLSTDRLTGKRLADWFHISRI